MHILYCTITGVDDQVDPDDLSELSRLFPFVEWAVSYDPSRAGQPLYPSTSWIDHFHKACPASFKAIHLSGDGLGLFRSGSDVCLRDMGSFARVQLNLDDEKDRSRENVERLVVRMQTLPEKKFIFPLNSQSEHLLPLFENIKISLLFDSSGGRGKNPERWPSPLAGYDCGYAGGLSPTNLRDNLTKLSSFFPGDTSVWIDMQTGVRGVENLLDLKKVTSVLEAVQRHTRALPERQ